jgi:hypothetical protein
MADRATELSETKRKQRLEVTPGLIKHKEVKEEDTKFSCPIEESDKENSKMKNCNLALPRRNQS